MQNKKSNKKNILNLIKSLLKVNNKKKIELSSGVYYSGTVIQLRQESWKEKQEPRPPPLFRDYLETWPNGQNMESPYKFH